MAPCPSLSQRAEDVWGVFNESFSTVVGMGVGTAPNKACALTVFPCETTEFWMLFGDLERAWVGHMNEKKPDADA